MHSPRGGGPRSWVPRKNQAAQAPRKVWAVTCACSRLGGCFGPSKPKGGPTPQPKPLRWQTTTSLTHLWHSQRRGPVVWEHSFWVRGSTKLEAPWDNDLLTPDSLSCVVPAPSEYLHGSQPQSSPWGPISEASASAPSPPLAMLGVQTASQLGSAGWHWSFCQILSALSSTH